MEKLISLNESSQQLCAVFTKLKGGDLSLPEGQRQVELVAVGDSDPAAQSTQASQPAYAGAPASKGGDTIDLLGMDDYSPLKTAAAAATPAVVQSPLAPQAPQVVALAPQVAPIPVSSPQPAAPVQPLQAPVRIPGLLAKPPGHGQSAVHSAAPLAVPVQAPVAQKLSAAGDPFGSDPLDLFGISAPAQTTASNAQAPQQPADQFAPAAAPLSGMKADPLALFGAPAPVRGECDQGCLSYDFA